MDKSLIFLEWLGKHRETFLSNKGLDPLPVIEKNYICGSFVWKDTLEGHKFWKKINKLWQLEVTKSYDKVLYERPPSKVLWLK